MKDINKKSEYFKKELNNFFFTHNYNAKIYNHDSIIRIDFSKKHIINRSARDFFEKKYIKKIKFFR